MCIYQLVDNALSRLAGVLPALLQRGGCLWLNSYNMNTGCGKKLTLGANDKYATYAIDHTSYDLVFSLTPLTRQFVKALLSHQLHFCVMYIRHCPNDDPPFRVTP